MTAELHDLAQPWPGALEAVQRCPVCADSRRAQELADLQDRSFAAAPGTWRLQRCLGCQALYLDPRPDGPSLHLAYRNYYTHAAVPATFESVSARVKKAITNGYRNRFFATNLRPSLALGGLVMPLFPVRAGRIRREDRGLGRAPAGGRRLLDVGCGNGQFLQWARELGWWCHGAERDAAAAAVARAHGIEILGSDLQELGPAHDRTFDAITLSHVIEHVYDPIDTLRHCWRLLKPGGYLWIQTPNAGSVGYEIYGAHWRGLEPPRHLVLFNPPALRACLERVGFERIRILPPDEDPEQLFLLSASMQLGRIAEKDARPLPQEIRKRTRAAARHARALVRGNPERSEFVTAIANRPDAAR
jgi:2-polyprenyl-3-methyl-5-hydroxy-6-metoxy-1,4-benzoquinol methylase